MTFIRRTSGSVRSLDATTPGLVAWYPVGFGPGAFADALNGYDLQPIGGLAVMGIQGRNFWASVQDGYLEEIGQAAALNITGDLTIQWLGGWQKLQSNEASSPGPFGALGLVTHGETGATAAENTTYAIEYVNSDLAFQFTQESGTKVAEGIGTPNLYAASGVRHWAVTRSGNQLAYYCDGFPMFPPLFPLSGPPSGGSNGRLRVFQGIDTSADRPRAFMRDLQICNVALTAQQVFEQKTKALGFL